MITFPTIPEAFIAYQEQLVGRPLSMKEKELAVAWLECFNLSYEDGLERDRSALEESIALLDELMKRHEDLPNVHRFAEACRAWIAEAWRQGAERSELK